MGKSGINRRQFLESGRTAVAGGVAVSIAAGLPNSAWAKDLNVFDQETADLLLRMCRVLYPHDDLSDDHYAVCVEGLDEKAKADAGVAQILIEGAKNLNVLVGRNFLDLDEAAQVKALKNIEGTPFFQMVRGHLVVALYNNRNVWEHFGYEGPSFPYGGYLERGFNDIDWLADS